MIEYFEIRAYFCFHYFRGVFDRQDSLRSDYLSDRETRYGIVQQASIDSTDSRLCYLTSSEVGFTKFSFKIEIFWEKTFCWTIAFHLIGYCCWYNTRDPENYIFRFIFCVIKNNTIQSILILLFSKPHSYTSIWIHFLSHQISYEMKVFIRKKKMKKNSNSTLS